MRKIVCHLLAFGLGLQLSFAQEKTSEIRGRVESEQGARIQRARVRVFSQEPAFDQETTTDADGTFSFWNLAAGTYQVEASAPGYAGQQKDGIQVQDGKTIEINFRLAAALQAQSLIEVEARGKEERNPNIFITKIDLNALRDSLRRWGASPVFLEFSAVKNLYAADLGAPLRQISTVRPAKLDQGFHGSIYEEHQNSALNARPFFNVGPLRPARRNQFGFSLSGPIDRDKLSFSTRLDIVRESGFVNGNVRVPLLKERVPTASDPLTRRIIGALLKGFPEETPNLPDITPRQLNTNAEKDIDSQAFNIKLDYSASNRDRLAFRYDVLDYSEDPFELVAGANPQTDLRSQSLSATNLHTFSPRALLEGSFYFDRQAVRLLPTKRFRSLLEPLGLPDVPDIDFGGEFADLTPLGPGTQFPRLRFQNRFAGEFNFSLLAGRHQLRLGGSLMRVQLNDLQSDNSRGRFIFSSNFGRTAIENFLRGTPSRFTITMGNLHRNFRHWESSLYIQDTFQVRPGFALTLGLRYERVTTPSEVNGLTLLPYSDANNFAPQFGFAWNPKGGSLVVRGGYGVSFGQVFAGTFQLARFNPPAVRTVTIQNPSLVDPLKSLQVAPGELGRSDLNLLSPDLDPPYAHQFNLQIEKRLAENLFLRVGYIGNRTIKLFFPFVSNRAQPVPDIPATTATIDQRRPDPRFLSVKTIINSGVSYYDALKISLAHRFARGLAFDFDYVFSKALTSGFDFANTLNREKGIEGNQNNVDFQADMRGPTAFDMRNAINVNYSYELPFKFSGRRATLIFSNWKVSGTTVYRTGGWFDISTSSDAPGFGNVDGEDGDRPNITNPAILGKAIDDPDTSTSILNPEFFNTNIPPGGRGNLGLRVFRKDSLINTNLALTKAFVLANGKTVEFQTELINLFNHPWFERPGDVFPSPTFGKIIDTQNKGRVVKFLLRINF